jgi:apolipoprotein N-acyltransferase
VTAEESPRRGTVPPLSIRAVLSSMAGAALFASLPPRGWWWAGVAGMAVLASTLRGQPWRVRSGLGYLAGLGWFVPALWWVAGFSLPGYVLLVIVQAAFVALASLLTWRGRVALMPAALVVAEWTRSGWPFGGFPLAGPNLGQVDAPYVGVTTLAGPLGLMVVTALAGMALAELARRQVRRAGLVAVVVAVLAATGAAAVGTTHAASADQRVAVVQGGGPRGIPAVVSENRHLFERHDRLSTQIPDGTQLVVWPEGVVDLSGSGSTHERDVAALAERLGATVVAGVTEQAPDDRFRNAAVAWAPAGGRTDRYDKVHRVPFGEYVPARAILDRVVDLSLVPRDAVPGDEPGVLTTPFGRLGVAISFEVFFPERARAAVRAGGQLLVIPTNAASFTTDEVPTQQLAAARLRAIETGRSLLLAGPTGYSAIIAHDGTVAARSELGATQLVTGEITLRDGATPYTRLGDVPLLLVAAGTLIFGFDVVRRRCRRRPHRQRFDDVQVVEFGGQDDRRASARVPVALVRRLTRGCSHLIERIP